MVDFIASVVILFSIVALVQTVRAKNMVTEKFGYNYIIKISNLEEFPNLQTNPHFKGKVRFVASSDGVYSVQSKINDAVLKEIIMVDYQLNNNQVVVQPAVLPGAVGMM